MKRLLSTAALSALLAAGAGPASATSILYFVDGNNGTDQMAAALAALSGDTITTTNSPTVFATDIATPGAYQLGIFSAQEAYGTDYSAALTALHTFVLGGGKAIVDSWFTPGYTPDIAQFGADATGDVNGPAVNMTGYNSGVTNPVGLTNPIPPYATFSVGMSLDATNGTSIDGTFYDPGNASGTNGEAAVIAGDGGNSIVNGFLNDTAGAAGEAIYTNEIDALLAPSTAPVPEPITISLFGVGLVGAVAMRRRKKTAAKS